MKTLTLTISQFNTYIKNILDKKQENWDFDTEIINRFVKSKLEISIDSNEVQSLNKELIYFTFFVLNLLTSKYLIFLQEPNTLEKPVVLLTSKPETSRLLNELQL